MPLSLLQLWSCICVYGLTSNILNGEKKVDSVWTDERKRRKEGNHRFFVYYSFLNIFLSLHFSILILILVYIGHTFPLGITQNILANNRKTTVTTWISLLSPKPKMEWKGSGSHSNSRVFGKTGFLVLTHFLWKSSKDFFFHRRPACVVWLIFLDTWHRVLLLN